MTSALVERPCLHSHASSPQYAVVRERRADWNLRLDAAFYGEAFVSAGEMVRAALFGIVSLAGPLSCPVLCRPLHLLETQTYGECFQGSAYVSCALCVSCCRRGSHKYAVTSGEIKAHALLRMLLALTCVACVCALRSPHSRMVMPAAAFGPATARTDGLERFGGLID